jgi:phenylpropionate dioxygenase-like ring-hydroxylating dioxygenase large terminal subunit
VTTVEARPAPRRRPRRDQGRDWSAWPHYDAAATGFRGYWYPVMWANQLTGTPQQLRLCDDTLAILRDSDGRPKAVADRCPHRGVPLSEGTQEWPGTITCPYHGFTYDLETGVLRAAITDGPDSPICGKLSVRAHRCEERFGLVWVYAPIGDEDAPPLDRDLPEEWLIGAPFTLGGRVETRTGNWRFATENGYDEGHAKFLHRTSLWRLFKAMPTWNKTHIEDRGRWLYRVQDEVHWEAEYPGLGRWTGMRWWKLTPPAAKTGAVSNIGNTGGAKKVDPVIAGREFPGFASISLPGVLRIVYPQFIHYEFYVPVDADHHCYVGIMIQFKTGWRGWWYRVRYLGGIRWLFHGNFSNQDAWMVENTDAPPERLYRPDISLIAWRRLCERGDGRVDPDAALGREPAPVTIDASENEIADGG